MGGIGAYFFLLNKGEEPPTEPPTESPIESPIEMEKISKKVSIPEAITTTMSPTTTAATPRPTTAAPYEIGQPISCISNDVGGGTKAIYRYDGNNTLRLYPDAKIAKQWDSNYLNAKKIDCEDLKMGTNMTEKLEVGVQPDPDYVGLKQSIDTNYQNIPSSCYSAAGGECNNLRYEDCDAEMKSFEKYGKMVTAGDFVIRQSVNNQAKLVWRTGTQYLNADAKFILGEDGILRVISNGTNYWRSSNSESTNGPFAAHLEKVDGKCRISIYDKDNTNLWSSSD